MTTTTSPPLANNELAQVIALVKCENEGVLMALSEQISSLSQQLLEVTNLCSNKFPGVQSFEY